MSLLCLSALLIALWASPVVAQRPACADSVSRALSGLIGTWDVRPIFRNGSTWDSTSAQAQIRPDFEGCVLREELLGTRYGQPFRVLNLWGAVGLHDPIQRTFVHSQHGVIGVFAGRIDSAGLIMRDSQVVSGRMTYFQHRFQPFPADSMRFSSLQSTDRGGTWLLTWYADYLRRVAPGPSR